VRMKRHKIVVCGSRFHTDVELIERVLDAYWSRLGHAMLLITGGAEGADEIARAWAVSRKCDHLVMYAWWDTEGKGAGPTRNRRMLDRKPHLVLAFYSHGEGHKNRGTNNMVKIAQDAGIKVKKFH